jgi:hypothetical protein
MVGGEPPPLAERKEGKRQMAGEAGQTGSAGWGPTFLRHRRLLRVLFAMSAVLAVGVALLGFWGRWFVGAIASAGYGVYVALPALVVTVLLCGARNRVLTVFAAVTASLVILGALLIPANILGYAVQRWQVGRAVRMAERVIEQIDAFRETHGRCPAHLAELEASGVAVRIPPFVDDGFYDPDNDLVHYTLCVEDPSWMFSAQRVYRSETRSWGPWDD